MIVRCSPYAFTSSNHVLDIYLCVTSPIDARYSTLYATIFSCYTNVIYGKLAGMFYNPPNAASTVGSVMFYNPPNTKHSSRIM